MRSGRLKGSYKLFPFNPLNGKKAFFAFLDRMRAEGVLGMNVTIPHKEWAYEYVAKKGGFAPGFHGACARIVGAVNTLVFTKSRVLGANTDAAGLWDDVEAWLGARRLRGANVIIVGTGGSARGAVAGLVAKHRATLTLGTARVWGRNQKARRELEHLISRRRFSAVAAHAQNETATVLLWCLPPLPARESVEIFREALAAASVRDAFFYDLNYGDRAVGTIGLVAKKRRRAGAGMLRRQARASFELWR